MINIQPSVLNSVSIDGQANAETKAKKNFGLLRKKLQIRFQAEKHKDQLEDESEQSSQEQNSHAIIQKFQVSSNSSDDEAYSFSPPVRSHVNTILAQNQQLTKSQKISQKKGYIDNLDPNNTEQQKAISNLRYIIRRKRQQAPNLDKNVQNTSIALNVLSPQPQTTQKYNFSRSSSRDKDAKSKEKQQLNYLRGLEQNSNVKSPTVIDECFEKNQISIHLETMDLWTFTRLQYEVEELQRRQRDYNDLRGRNFNLTRGDRILEPTKTKLKELKEQEEKRFNQSWFVGIALAKKFLKKAKKRNVNRIATSFIKNRISISPQKQTDNSNNVKQDLITKEKL